MLQLYYNICGIIQETKDTLSNFGFDGCMFFIPDIDRANFLNHSKCYTAIYNCAKIGADYETKLDESILSVRTMFDECGTEIPTSIVEMSSDRRIAFYDWYQREGKTFVFQYWDQDMSHDDMVENICHKTILPNILGKDVLCWKGNEVYAVLGVFPSSPSYWKMKTFDHGVVRNYRCPVHHLDHLALI